MLLLGLISLMVMRTALCQEWPKIVNDIFPEVITYARLNCTVTHEVSHNVHWMRMRDGLHIPQEESEKLCPDGSNKYEIIREQDGKYDTIILRINCLSNTDYGLYTCYIRITGMPVADWPNKVGYLYYVNELG